MAPERQSGFLWQAWLAAAIVAAAAAALSWTGAVWRLDAWYYDRLLASWESRVSDRVVIVAVDEQSLEELGQWPWPRTVHAALVDRLTGAGVRGIAFDVLFSEPARDGGRADAAFAAAIARNGHTVLPIVPERTRQNGVLVESMQVPSIGVAATRFGHTDVELDEDDVARNLYLRAGLGGPNWPALGLALLQQEPRLAPDPLPGLRAPANDGRSPYLWQRDHHVLLRYAGPPGSFAQLSYADVLAGRIDPRLLRDRWVVVGVTAANIGRMFLTPMSTTTRMSGAEYQANVVEMLLQRSAIVPLSPAWQVAMSAALAWLIALAAGATGNRRPWLTMLLAVAVPLASSLVLLRAMDAWFAPMPAIVAVLAGHLLWTLAHLRHWRLQASTDPLTGVANRRSFDHALADEIASARRTQAPLSLLLIDVDHFKHYNDSRGHHAGDRALMAIAALILEHTRRPRDLAARIGGDEFALILPETPASGAERVAQRLVESARVHAALHGAPGEPRISLSIGAYTCVPDATATAKSLFDRADAALYRAKERGRDGYQAAAPAPLDETVRAGSPG